MHYAAADGCVSKIQMLLEHGADPAVRSIDADGQLGQSTVHLAGQWSRLEALQLLLSRCGESFVHEVWNGSSVADMGGCADAVSAGVQQYKVQQREQWEQMLYDLHAAGLAPLPSDLWEIVVGY